VAGELVGSWGCLGRFGAVDSEDGGAIVREEEAGEGACRCKLVLFTSLAESVNSPGARPASSTTRMPARGGAITVSGLIVYIL